MNSFYLMPYPTDSILRRAFGIQAYERSYGSNSDRLLMSQIVLFLTSAHEMCIPT